MSDTKWFKKLFIDEAKAALSAAGSGGGIVDAEGLPTENVNPNSFYRVNTPGSKTSSAVYYIKSAAEGVEGPINEMAGTEVFSIEIVDSLPEVGTAFIDLTVEKYKFYYNCQDNTVYGYVDEDLFTEAPEMVPSIGWYPASQLVSLLNTVPYGGIVTSTDQMTSDGIYLLVDKLSGADGGKDIVVTTGEMEWKVVDEPSSTLTNVTSAMYYMEATPIPSFGDFPFEWIIVDSLPVTGKEFGGTLSVGSTVPVYYNCKDGKDYIYLSENSASEAEGAVAGWNLASLFWSEMAAAHGGTITSLEQATDSNTVYVLVDGERQYEKPVINVTELPTEDIDTGSVYKVTKYDAKYYHPQAGFYPNNPSMASALVCHVVDGLPTENISPAVTFTSDMSDMHHGETYYNIQNGKNKAYIDATLSAASDSLFGTHLDEGWYDAGLLFSGALGVTYGGVISSTSQATDSSALYLVIETECYSYQIKWHSILSSPAIIDVDKLPTSDINKNVFYRVMTKLYTYQDGWKEADTGVSEERVNELIATNAISEERVRELIDGSVTAAINGALEESY